MEIQALKGHRWFIWTLVAVLVAGAVLVTYINYSSATSPDYNPLSLVVHHPKPAKASVQTPPAAQPKH